MGGNKVEMADVGRAVMLGLPFFFWGTNMVVMESVTPTTGVLFVAAMRLLPAGALILAFAMVRRARFPSGLQAWFSIALFAIINGALFQSCLAEGLTKTTAGLGSVIIDSQPLTVAVLAAVFYGEILRPKSIVALTFGILGLLMIEVPVESLGRLLHSLLPGLIALPPLNSAETWSIWDSGAWWMLLSAQCMAIGTVMMRWVSKFSDPLMVIGWHMVLGGIPVLALSFWKQDPAVSGHIRDLTIGEWAGLFYTSVFGSAIATGLYFYNATKGSLTELSALTLLTPVFATMFGYLFRNETLTGIELVGSLITLVSICFVKVEKPPPDSEELIAQLDDNHPAEEPKYQAVPEDPLAWAEEALSEPHAIDCV